MSDEHSPIPPEPTTIDAEPAPAEVPPSEAPEPPRATPRRRRQLTLVPWIYALALVVLGGAVMFLWWHPTGVQSQPAEAERVAALNQQVETLGAEVKQLAARPAGQPQEISALQAQLAALAARQPATPDLSGLERRIDALEQRKPEQAAPAPDLAPVQQKVAALEQQVAALTQAGQAPAQSGADQTALAAQSQQVQEQLKAQSQQTQEQLGAQSRQTQERLTAQNQQVQERLQQVQDRLTTLSTQAQDQLTALNKQIQDRSAAMSQQIAALSGRIDGFAALRDDIGQLDQKLDQLGREQQGETEKIQSLTTAQKNAESGLTSRIGNNETVIQELRDAVRKLDAGLNRATTAAQAQAALAALAAGRPVGTISGAPSAVTRYATEPPPTLAELRRSFDAVAAQAQAASRPAGQGDGFLDRVWTRAQGLVTVRQGDHVIVGDPAAGVIAQAREDLDVGDLAGAVEAVSKMTGPAAPAMAGWLQSARSLLAARTALIGMAGQG